MDAYIVSAKRSPIGKANKGALAMMRTDDLAAQVIRKLLDDLPSVEPSKIDDLIVGCAVPEAEQGMQIGRMISLLALPCSVSGMLLNRYCGSGLEAIHLAAARVAAGTADCVLAGGAESMSGQPMMGYRPSPNPTLVRAHPEYFLSMGMTAEELAVEDNISREEADKFALRSHQRALQAQEKALFEEEIVPIKVERTFFAEGKLQKENTLFATDEGPRKDTTIEALAALRPVFKQAGQVTAGNSSQTSDGAAFVMVCSEAFLKHHELRPIAQLRAYATAGVDPRIMGIGPVDAIPKALKQANLSISDMSQIEINEAFATQVLAVCKRLELPPEQINSQGGAIALGHPLGCTGAKLSVQILHALRRDKQKYGLVSACVGGGQGVAGIFECFV